MTLSQFVGAADIPFREKEVMNSERYRIPGRTETGGACLHRAGGGPGRGQGHPQPHHPLQLLGYRPAHPQDHAGHGGQAGERGGRADHPEDRQQAGHPGHPGGLGHPGALGLPAGRRHRPGHLRHGRHPRGQHRRRLRGHRAGRVHGQALPGHRPAQLPGRPGVLPPGQLGPDQLHPARPRLPPLQRHRLGDTGAGSGAAGRDPGGDGVQGLLAALPLGHLAQPLGAPAGPAGHLPQRLRHLRGDHRRGGAHLRPQRGAGLPHLRLRLLRRLG